MSAKRFFCVSSKAVILSAVCGLTLLSGCAVGNPAVSSGSLSRTPMSISGTVHGGQQPIGGSVVQLWETGGGTAGVGGTATATLGTGSTSDQIASIAVTSGGSGYTTAPTVTITDSTGTGASATAVLSATDGTIASITLNGGGSGYTAPTVSLSGGIAPNGYGLGAVQLVASTTTAALTGAFSFPTANVPSNCKTGPFAYITASGGDPTGATQNNINSTIELVAMLGSCSTTGASTNVDVNELTTVAAAYALGNFATDSGGTVNIGAPLTNSQGLADAVANALLLVNSSTGAANASTASMALPTAMVNSLGNSIAACVNTNYSASPGICASLFSYSTPPSGAAPADVFQAVLNMAKYPGSNVGNILAIATASAPFAPTVSVTSTTATSAPNDLTLGIAYPNSTLALAYASVPVASLAIDSTDNVWVVGAANGTTTSTYNYITELTSASAGASLSNTLGSTAALNGTHSIHSGAFDTAGNFFLTDKNASAGSLIEVASGNTVAQAAELTAFGSTLSPNDWAVALDASQNAWTTSYGAPGSCSASTSGTICEYVEYKKSGTTYTPTISFGGLAAVTPVVRGIAADAVSTSAGLGNIWTTNYGITGTATTKGNTVEALTASTGALSTYTIGSSANQPLGVALDASGNAYVTTSYGSVIDGLYRIAQGAASSTISSTVSASGQATTIPNANSSAPASNAKTPFAVGGLNNGPGYDAVDGAGNVWVANYSYASLVEYSPSQSAFLSPYYGFSPGVSIAPYNLTATAITITSTGASNIYVPGFTVVAGELATFSGFSGNYAFLNGNTYPVTIPSPSSSTNYFIIPTPGVTAIKNTNTSGTVTISSVGQTVFTCATATTVTCTINGVTNGANNAIGIDRAGSVWTLGVNGTLTEMIGTAAPTNPILSAGQSGSLP